MIYFTADTHFGSLRTLELSKRPFKTTDEMDQYIIDQWNNIVGPDDYVYHLGDFGNYSVRSKLHGNIILILGNYDEAFLSSNKDNPKEIQKMANDFTHIYQHLVLPISKLDVDISSVQDKIKELYLVHKPNDCLRISNTFNLFGHIHGRQLVKRYGIDVGVDAHHFRPVSAKDAVFYMNAIVNDIYDSNVYD